VDIAGRDTVRVNTETKYHLLTGNSGAVDEEGLWFVALTASANVGTVTLSYGDHTLAQFGSTPSGVGGSAISLAIAAPVLTNILVNPAANLTASFTPQQLGAGQMCAIMVRAPLPGPAVDAFAASQAMELDVERPDFSDAFLEALFDGIDEEYSELATQMALNKASPPESLETEDTFTLESMKAAVNNTLAKDIFQSAFPEEKAEYETMWSNLSDEIKWGKVQELAWENILKIPSFEPQSAECQEFEAVSSLDPNDKVGPEGFGNSRTISRGEPLPYEIYFENVHTATAPAQTVKITDQLSPTAVDLSTFSFGPVTFGKEPIMPPLGVDHFTTDIDLRPAQDLIVRVSGQLDSETGLLTWLFESLDPVTGEQPEDPMVGFLPPNINPPQGEGSVSFTVMPNQQAPSGTQVRNKAEIVFDNNAPILTPEWLNTLWRCDTFLPLLSFSSQ